VSKSRSRENHAEAIAAIDMCVVPMLTFDLLFALLQHPPNCHFFKGSKSLSLIAELYEWAGERDEEYFPRSGTQAIFKDLMEIAPLATTKSAGVFAWRPAAQ
jgi:hypothetical protein